jgi:hypothetical protein
VKAALLALALACIAGCVDHPHVALFREDFESVCNGAPCGWTQIAGPAGAASYVETLPSEHGVELVGDGVAIARTVTGANASTNGAADQIDATLRAHVVARCDPGATVTVIATLLGAGTSIDVEGGATYPPTWDGSRIVFMLLPVEPTNAGASFTSVVRVVLHKQGAGACEVDYVSLADHDIPFPE